MKLSLQYLVIGVLMNIDSNLQKNPTVAFLANITAAVAMTVALVYAIRERKETRP